MDIYQMKIYQMDICQKDFCHNGKEHCPGDIFMNRQLMNKSYFKAC